MIGHSVKSYEASLNDIDRTISEIGGNSERLIAEAFSALLRRDPKRADAALALNIQVNELERSLQTQATQLLAHRLPSSRELRRVVTVLKIGADLVRIAGLGASIARGATKIAYEVPPRALMSGFAHMAERAQTQLKDVLDSNEARDTDRAMSVWNADASIDMLYNSLFREMLTYMMDDKRNIAFCTHLLFGAKSIERIGDHTTNIAESIFYLVHGVHPAGDRPKGEDPQLQIGLK